MNCDIRVASLRGAEVKVLVLDELCHTRGDSSIYPRSLL